MGHSDLGDLHVGRKAANVKSVELFNSIASSNCFKK